MMRSLFSGVSGIKVHQTRMDVIGNNIANINTIGFKGSRTTFSDMFSQMQANASAPTDTRGGVNPRQIGLGVNVESIDLMFSDASPTTTGKNTDLALAGNGLFVLKEGNESYYTRNGSFLFDEGGHYVMAGTGLRVQGWNATPEGILNTNGASTDIIVPVGKTMEAKETTKIDYSGNLDKETRIIKSITYTVATSGDANENRVVTKNTVYNTAVTITPPTGFTSPSGNISGSIKGSTKYAESDDVSSAIKARYEAVGDPDEDGHFRYAIVYTDENGNELGRATSDNVLDTPPTDTTVTATASSDSSLSKSTTTSVNVDGKNVVAATITYKDGTTSTVTSGYYEVGKSVPITTLATIYDSLGGKHEVTLLIDKDPDSTAGDATPTEEDAIATGKTIYTYKDDNGAEKTVSLANNDTSISGNDTDGYKYTKNYKVTRTGEGTTESPYVYTSETGHVLTDAEAATVQGNKTDGFNYTATLDVTEKSDPFYDNRWRVYIAPGEGEKGPADGGFKNSYTHTETDGTKTIGTMNMISYLYFNDKGAFVSNGTTKEASVSFEYADGNGAASNQAALDYSGLTQYANSTTSFPTTNGNTAGVLQSISIDSNGIISGSYTNGLIRNEAQVAVAQFTNNSGLAKVGTTIYQQSNNSGSANIRTIADFGMTVTSSALEMSNVDLATEFAEMIVTQRGFQANSKITTVSDEMLETLIGMKR